MSSANSDLVVNSTSEADISHPEQNLKDCNIVYGVHPHTIYLIIAIFSVAAVISFFIGFCASRCFVNFKRRKRRKYFNKSSQRPSVSSPSLRRSENNRNSTRDRSSHRASAVGLLRTADELRQHNPTNSTLKRPFTFHEMSDDHTGGLSGIVFMSDFNSASRDNINKHSAMQPAPEFSPITKPPRSVLPTRPLGPRVSLSDVNSSVVLRRNHANNNTPLYDESRIAARRMSSYGDLKSTGNLTRISERSSDVSKEDGNKNRDVNAKKAMSSSDSLPLAPERVESLNPSTGVSK